MDREEQEFHRRRAEQELQWASLAAGAQAWKAHADLAELHLQRSKAPRPTLSLFRAPRS